MTRQAYGPRGLGLRPRPGGLGSRLRSIFTGAPPADETWDDLEEALVAADFGPTTSLALVDAACARAGSSGDPAAIREALAAEMRSILDRTGAGRFELGPPPSVLLFVGVNGAGKTTSIAKLAARLRHEGRSVILAAADTFRAAAIEQLRVWGDALGVPVVAQRSGADPGAVAFDAVQAAESRGIDAVLIDTAGRLQNRTQLMEELAKIRRVVERRLPEQPRHVLLVLDATTGQNGVAQAEGFGEEVGVTGVVLTKLDGTAKGGVVLAIAERLGVPVIFAGVGEGPDDLAPFDAAAYVDWLLTPA